MPFKFSPSELSALHNAIFFRTKASVTNKTDLLLSLVRDEIKSEIKAQKITLSKNIDVAMGKIFKGENYLGLPYLILDYPKHFSSDSVFAFRIMMWWGKFFSCTLHLQGEELDKYRKHIILNIPKLKNKKIFFCINNTPWQYHYKKDNYVLIDKLKENMLVDILMKKEFIKLSRKIPLHSYNALPTFSKESFSYFTGVLFR